MIVSYFEGFWGDLMIFGWFCVIWVILGDFGLLLMVVGGCE